MKLKNYKEIEVALMDYKDRISKFAIKSLEKAILCRYAIVTGDEILTIIYNNCSCVSFDSCQTRRLESICDEEFFFFPSQLEKINELKGEDTYTRAEELYNKVSPFQQEIVKAE